MRSVEEMQYWLTMAHLETAIAYEFDKNLHADLKKICVRSWYESEDHKYPVVANAVFKVGKYRYEVDQGDSLMLVNALCDGIERIFGEPEYRICRSPVLQDLAKYWTDKGRRSQFKNLADEVIPFSAELVKGARFMAKQLQGNVPRVWIAVCANNDALLFKTEEEGEAAQRFSQLQPKKEAVVPKKVLAKMLLLRIEKLHKIVIGFNVQLIHNLTAEQTHLENEAKAKAAGITNTQYYYNPFQKPADREAIEVVPMESLRAIASYEVEFARRSGGWQTSGVTALLKEIKDLSQRPQFDDTVVADAWNMFVIKEIHNS